MLEGANNKLNEYSVNLRKEHLMYLNKHSSFRDEIDATMN